MSSCTADEKTVIHVHRIVNTPLVARAISLLPKHKRPAFICTVHLIEPARIGKKYSKAYNALDRVIFVSKKSKDCFLSSSPNIDSAKLTVIYNSTKVVPAQVEKNTDNTSPISLCFVGRLYKEKGVDTIIEALPKIDNAILAVCGTGPEAYVNELKALSQRLGVDKRIDWVGFTDKVAEYISRADIGLIPSRWEEPCALVNFEYMAAGTPLVTSNTGGQPELITDGVDGLLVAPDDADALANAINRLIDNPELRTKFGNAARETFERRFTYDKFYAEVMAAYDNAIRHRK